MTARHLVLTGLMGSGKTSVGRVLAARLGRPFVDNDVTLFRRTGRSARDIEADKGADALHRAEADALVEALGADAPAVVGAAAATIEDPAVRSALGAHDVVYLCAPPEILAPRAEHDDDSHRPFVAGGALEVLRAQFSHRDPLYRATATVVVDAARPVDEVVAAVSAALGLP